MLQFDGASYSDQYGLNIDNVQLTSPYTNYDLIKNGGFENPNLGGGWNYFNGGIPHWTAVKAEVGHCKNTYNANWPASSGQCIELDSDSNQRYTQTITVSQMAFNQILINKSTLEGTAAVQNHLACATSAAQSQISSAVAVIKHNIAVQIAISTAQFNGYLCGLYGSVGQTVKDITYDGVLVMKKFDCLSQAYLGQFGSSNEPDYTDLDFDVTNL